MPKRRTKESFLEVLPELLAERQLSLRALARMVGVGDDHLSRVLRGARGKRPTAELIARVSAALDLPADFFPEARAAFVCERIGDHPSLRDRVYDQLRRACVDDDRARGDT